jgi:hypothetical protein
LGERLASYEAFWPFYVSQHAHPTNRLLHFVGTAFVLLTLVASLAVSWTFILAAPLLGYGFAWIGHFVFERNRPATFTYPVWSLRGDFRMFRLMLLGRMGPEIEKASHLYPA